MSAQTVDRELCLNFAYKRVPCRRCRDRCPAGCFDDSLVHHPKNCTDCGLCLAVCPVGAIAGENYAPQSVEKILADDFAPLVLACRRRDSDSPWPCLGFLDGRLLLALALSGKNGDRQIVIDNLGCDGCKPGVADHLREIIGQVNDLLAAAGKTPLTTGPSAGQTAKPQKKVTRRTFFQELLGATLDTVREVVAPTLGAERLTRQEWFERYADGLHVDDTASSLFHNIAVGEGCRACGLCARVCQAKALTVKDHGAFLELFHSPLKCTGCGVCVAHCPQTLLSVTDATRLGDYLAARCDLPRCTACGQLYQPVGDQTICLECMFNNKQLSL